MSNLSQDIRELQAAASLLCPQCLRDEITVRADSLDGLADRLEQATAARNSAPDGDQHYLDVFGEVIATLLVLATFTTELTKRPADSWVVHVSPN